MPERDREDERARIYHEYLEGNAEGSARPFRDPVEAFRHLAPATRKWLGALREQDIRLMQRAMLFYSSATTVGKFLRWIAVVFAVTFGLFGGLAAFSDHLASLWKTFIGAPR